MGRFKKIILLMVVGALSLGTMVSCASKGVQEKENVVLETAPEEKKDNSGYLPLGEDPHADDAIKVQNSLLEWNFASEDGKKVAYLTFDDGPSTVITEKVLDVLKTNDVKATFFVLGTMVDKNQKAKDMLKRMVNEGHAIGNHGYSHKYEQLYPNGTTNVTAFMDDMNKSLNSMKAVLGADFHTRVMRFPGGHSAWNTIEIDKYLEENNFAFIDWNTLTGDADAVGQTKEQLVNNLKQTVTDIETNNDKIVVLMHDTNAIEENPEVVQGVIEHLKSLGYEFRTLK